MVSIAPLLFYNKDSFSFKHPMKVDMPTPTMGSFVPLLFFYKDSFSFEYPIKVNMPIPTRGFNSTTTVLLEG